MSRLLSPQVTVIARIGHDAFDERCVTDIGIKVCAEIFNGRLRLAGHFAKRRATHTLRRKCVADGIENCSASLECRPTQIVNQPEIAAKRREPFIGVVSAEAQTMFSAAGKHTIRFARGARDEVVHHHAEIRLVAPDAHEIVAERQPSGIRAGNHALAAASS
jgi:hypothetical protein